MTAPITGEPGFRTTAATPADILARMSPEELRAHLMALQQVTEAALANLVLPELLRELLNRLCALLSVDTATVLLCSPDGESLLVRASRGLEEEVEEQVQIPIGQGIAGVVAVRRQAVIVDDVAQVATVSPVVRRLSSMMVAPLLVEGDLLGVLHVGTLRPRVFEDRQLYLLQIVADRVALAIKNALLYDEAQAQLRERERAEGELRQREQLHALLVGTSADAIVSIDTQGVIVAANRAAADTFGYAPEELVGQPLTLLIPQRLRAPHLQGIERYLRTGERRISWERLDLPGLHRSGREILLEVSFAEGATESGRFFTGTMRDVTEQRRTARLLAVQAAVTRSLAEANDVAEGIRQILRDVCGVLDWDMGVFWSPDASGRALRAAAVWTSDTINAEEFTEITRGLTLEAGVGLPGRVWKDQHAAWIPDVTQDSNFPRLSVAARVGIHGAFAFPACVADDCVGVLEFFTRRAVDPDEALLGVMEGMGSDIGQFVRRRDAEARLQRREEVQRFLAQVSSTLAAATLNFQDTVRHMVELCVPRLADWCSVYLRGDDGALRRVDLRHADAADDDLAKALSRYPFRPDPSHPIVRAVETRQPVLLPAISDEVVRAVAVDESHRALLERVRARAAIAVPLLARDRALGSMLLVATREERVYDAEQLEVVMEFAHRAALALDNARLYRDAQEANRAKSEFLAVMSHELRTPLNAIVGYSDLLAMGVADPERATGFVDRIGVSARHLAQLIDEILSFSRLEAGRESVQRAPLVVSRLLDEVRAIAEPLAAERQLRLRVTAQAEPDWTITADPGKLRQILLNLVGNAVKFTDQGEVEVTAGPQNGDAVFRVRDTGIGIAPEHQQKIFEPFWQVEQSTTRVAGGTGLGLSVTRRLVELLGGSIELDSTPGEGSTFAVRIPAGPR